MKKYGIILAILFLISVPAWALNYGAVDSRAMRTPVEYNDDLPRLVSYLVKPYAHDEDKKARVLLAWVVFHIDYNQYIYRKIQEQTAHHRKRIKMPKEQVDTFQMRLGACEDIAKLYVRMATLAGLESKIIYGYAGYHIKKSKLNENRHAWVAVLIDHKWELIDPTWAMQGNEQVFRDVRSNGAYSREIRHRSHTLRQVQKARRKRTIDERWYKTDPREMIKSHYPDDPENQFLAYPKSLHSFVD